MKKSFRTAVLLLVITITEVAPAQDNFQYINSCLFHDSYISLMKFGNLIYCSGVNGLQIIDAADPIDPVFVKNCDYPNIGMFSHKTRDITNRFYSYSGGNVWIFDISDSLNPALENVFHVQYGSINELAVNNGIAFIASGNPEWYDDRISIVDISNPLNPVLLSTIIYNSSILGLDVNNNYLYTIDYYGMPSDVTMRIYQLLNLENPDLISSTVLETMQYASDIYVADTMAFVSGYPGLWAIDVSDASNPLIRGYCPDYDLYEISSIDSLAYAKSYEGIQLFDVSNPQNIVHISQFDWDHPLNDLIINNDTAFFVGSNGHYSATSALNIVDFTSPYYPELIGQYIVPGSVNDVNIYEDYAYVANNYSGLRVINVSDPHDPHISASYETSDNALDICISDNFALLAINNGGLAIFDISNPQEPYLAGSFNLIRPISYVTAKENLAFLIAGSQSPEILILDITDHSNPILINAYDELYIPRSLQMVNNLAIISCLYSLELVDISDPLSPLRLASHPYREFGYNLCVADNYVYVACGSRGLNIFNITNPAYPILAGTYETSYVTSVTIRENYAYLSFTDRLELLDISNPEEPNLIASYANAGAAKEVFLQAGNIYVAAGKCFLILTLTPTGLEEFAVSNPSYFNLIQNYPNPFNTATVIHYDLPQQSDITLNIYDLLGRKVRTLYDGIQPPGEHSLIWRADGFSSGVYFYKLTAGDFSETKKMMLVK